MSASAANSAGWAGRIESGTAGADGTRLAGVSTAAPTIVASGRAFRRNQNSAPGPGFVSLDGSSLNPGPRGRTRRPRAGRGAGGAAGQRPAVGRLRLLAVHRRQRRAGGAAGDRRAGRGHPGPGAAALPRRGLVRPHRVVLRPRRDRRHRDHRRRRRAHARPGRPGRLRPARARREPARHRRAGQRQRAERLRGDRRRRRLRRDRAGQRGDAPRAAEPSRPDPGRPPRPGGPPRRRARRALAARPRDPDVPARPRRPRRGAHARRPRPARDVAAAGRCDDHRRGPGDARLPERRDGLAAADPRRQRAAPDHRDGPRRDLRRRLHGRRRRPRAARSSASTATTPARWR